MSDAEAPRAPRFDKQSDGDASRALPPRYDEQTEQSRCSHSRLRNDDDSWIATRAVNGLCQELHRQEMD
jgi:hypothetical protein